MKKIVLLSLVLLSKLNIAQNFAPIGAKWHYEVINGAGQQVGFLKWEVTGDTTINNLIYRKVDRNLGRFLLREEGSMVYWYNQSTGSEQLFFNRNPDVGEIWHYPYDNSFDIYFPYSGNFSNPIDSISLKVDAVEDTTFNGLPAKKINFSKRLSANEAFTILPNDFQSSYLAYTPFGFFQTFFLLGSGALLDMNYPIRLRCYEDEYWGLIHFNTAVACDSVRVLTSIHDLVANQTSVDIYPNPASDYLALHFTEPQGKSYQITVIDMHGRVLQNKTCVNDGYDSILLLQGYAVGTYLIHIQQNGKRVGRKIFVKQ